MKAKSLLQLGHYSAAWVRDFYAQAGIWWGPDVQERETHLARLEALERLCAQMTAAQQAGGHPNTAQRTVGHSDAGPGGVGKLRLLELGAGSGRTAALMADAGYDIVAVEINPTDATYARQLLETRRPGRLEFIEADFYTVALDGQFDVICYWDGFGIGPDADQRRLLRRMARQWLAPGGCVLLDVANPVVAVRSAGCEERLPPLDDVPGSVEMIHRCHFDALHCCWIDEWTPSANPEQSLAQTVRCYTPADFQLLLHGSGLRLQHAEVDGQALDITSGSISLGGPLMSAYSYLALLTAA